MKELENVNYKILNPGGNMTALVNGINYTKEEKQEINNMILSKNSQVEQVGFIDRKKNRLEMAGGEFCVNATRCAIWELLNRKSGKCKLSVSGYKEDIEGGILKDNIVYANMKLNRKIKDLISIKYIFNIVYLDGITLAVVNVENSKEYITKLKENEEKTKMELKNMMKNIEDKSEAMGIILLEKLQDKIKINPIIWVKSIDTLYYETACGSGSLATAIYLNYKYNTKEADIVQPSGYSINVKLEVEDETIKKCIISGVVEEV